VNVPHGLVNQFSLKSSLTTPVHPSKILCIFMPY